MPTPKAGETKKDFIDRCMSYPDMQAYDEDQRLAICQGKWDEKKSLAPDDIETRSFEMRVAKNDGKPPRLIGYAAVFDKWSEDLGGFRERVAPGAFARTLKTSDVRAMYEHDWTRILGRQRSKTLRLEENDKGLHVEIEPPDAQWARDLVASVERGDIDKMSFGFRTIKDEWDASDEKDIRRTLVDVDLFDVSIVSFPAYKASSVAVRHLEEMRRKRSGPLPVAPEPVTPPAVAAGNEDGPVTKKAKAIIDSTPGW